MREPEEQAAIARGDADAAERRRRPLGRALVEAYYRARRREQPPRRVALSVALGAFVGCLPLYGLHLVLCFGLARVLRLSGPLAYLAAHLNNPWTAPLLIYLELATGHRLLEGEWLSLAPSAWRDVAGLEMGRDLAVGAAVLGAVSALVLGAAAFWIASRARLDPGFAGLLDGTTGRYASLGIGAWETVRSKLRFDPVYLGILRSPVFHERDRVVDLGCGRGILLAAIRTAQSMSAAGAWPSGWPPMPVDLELEGIEADSSTAEAARQALGDEARIECSDVTRAEIPDCETIVCVDLLHYLTQGEQENLIARSAAALAPAGLFLMREADAGGGGRFWVTRAQERVCSWARREWRRPFHYRSASDWRALLEAHGFDVSTEPMWSGTPFSNVLFQARRSAK